MRGYIVRKLPATILQYVEANNSTVHMDVRVSPSETFASKEIAKTFGFPISGSLSRIHKLELKCRNCRQEKLVGNGRFAVSLLCWLMF